MINIMFVCLGNICRSPTAHGVCEALIREKGLQHSIQCHSSGTSDWHIGKLPDERAIKAASQRGYDLTQLRAEQINAHSDFEQLDYILPMDNANMADLQQVVPADFKGKLALFLDYHPDAALNEVPDPYYGGEEGFTPVLEMIETACNNLLAEIIDNHQLKSR